MNQPIRRSPLSGSEGRLLFRHEVLGRFPADYYLDETIGYIWVPNPTWLDEAYSDAIAVTDTGVMARNLRNISVVSAVMRHNGLADARGIDIGAGYGLFVRGMRDIGIDFHWSDIYAENLMARGLEAGDDAFDVAVAFEVLEHLPDPLSFLRSNRKQHGWKTLFFSATCFDRNELPKKDWWYWAFETGQHISFFSMDCLAFMADELGLKLVKLKSDIYAFTDKPSLVWPGKWARRRLSRRYKKASLTQTDYEVMKARLQAIQRD